MMGPFNSPFVVLQVVVAARSGGEILCSSRTTLQCMAAAVVCHMTENVAVCEELMRYGAVPVLIELLRGQQPELHSRCAVILADMAGHSSQYQIHIANL
ncbi:hypothetical protein NFI96_009098, partial [Prochilodus magdalenae]